MKVLVTGVSGRLGPFVVRELEQAGHELVLTSRREPPPEIMAVARRASLWNGRRPIGESGASLNPGMAKRPSRSMTSVCAVRNLSTSVLLPSAMILPSAIATASTDAISGSTV